MTVLNSLAPLVSVLLGAGITYWLNVRARRQSHVEDLFTDAIAAVAAAEASRDYISSVAPWSPDVSQEEYQSFLNWVRREATANHIQKVAAAREALARVVPYRPDLERYYRGTTSAVYEQAGEIIALLREGPAGTPGRWRLPGRRAAEGRPRGRP